MVHIKTDSLMITAHNNWHSHKKQRYHISIFIRYEKGAKITRHTSIIRRTKDVKEKRREQKSRHTFVTISCMSKTCYLLLFFFIGFSFSFLLFFFVRYKWLPIINAQVFILIHNCNNKSKFDLRIVFGNYIHKCFYWKSNIIVSWK